MVTPIVSSKYRHLYQLCYVKLFRTNQYENLVLLDDPGRVRSQITSVVCQIQRFDFDCILVVSRKLIIWTHPPLRLKLAVHADGSDIRTSLARVRRPRGTTKFSTRSLVSQL